MVAEFAAICGSLLRRKTVVESDPKEEPDPPPPPPSVTTTPSSSPPPNLEGTENVGNSVNEQQGQGYLLPLRPRMKSLHSMSHSLSDIDHLPRSSSVQKLKSNLSSTTILQSMSVRKSVNRNNDDYTESVEHNNGQGGWLKLKKKQEKLKPDDTLWTKPIILGEKCKVLEENEAVFYDSKGTRILSFRP